MLNAAVPSRAPSDVDLSIVVPVYNNSATLDELLDRLLAVVEPLQLVFEVILVDDGSRDDSLAILKGRAARNPCVRPFALVRNFGSQAAVCAGFDLARGRWVIAMDADLENCPEDIPAILKKLENGHDLVCGYRQTRNAPWLTRRLPSALMNRYVRRQTGTHIQDYACGMRGFQAWVVRDLESAGEARRLLTPLFLQRARLVTEVPLSRGVKHKSGGHSFLSLLGIAADYYMFTARRPFLISGLISVGAFGLAIVLILSGATLEGLVLIVGSLFGTLLSLVGEYCQRLYLLSQGTPFYELRDLEDRGQSTVDSR
jgi:glycosyltransferase involved in cell wall biosynthesis